MCAAATRSPPPFPAPTLFSALFFPRSPILGIMYAFIHALLRSLIHSLRGPLALSVRTTESQSRRRLRTSYRLRQLLTWPTCAYDLYSPHNHRVSLSFQSQRLFLSSTHFATFPPIFVPQFYLQSTLDVYISRFARCRFVHGSNSGLRASPPYFRSPNPLPFAFPRHIVMHIHIY